MKTLSLLLISTAVCSAQRYATDAQLANEAAARIAADSGKAGTSGEGVTASSFRSALGLATTQSPTWAGIVNTPISGGSGSFTTLAAAGNVSLGGATTNTIIFNGRIASLLTPSVTNTYDIATTALRFKDAWFAGAVTSATLITGAITTSAATNLTITPGTTGFIDIAKPSQTAARETMMRAKVSDGGNDAFFIYNGTITDSRFVPAFGGAQFSSNLSPSLLFKGATDSAADAGTTPMVQFETSRTSSTTDPFNGTSSPILNRPLFRFINSGADVGTVNALGNWQLPALTITGQTQLSASQVATDANSAVSIGIGDARYSQSLLGYASAVQDVTNSNAYTDSGSLAVSLGVGTWKIESLELVGSSAYATAGAQSRLTFTGVGTMSGVAMRTGGSTAEPTNLVPSWGGSGENVDRAIQYGTNSIIVRREGRIVVTAPGVLKVQFSQFTAVAAQYARMQIGSFLQATKY